MVATLHRARDEVNIKRSADIQNSNMSYRDAYGDGAGAWMEIAVNRKPTKVLFFKQFLEKTTTKKFSKLKTNKTS